MTTPCRSWGLISMLVQALDAFQDEPSASGSPALAHDAAELLSDDHDDVEEVEGGGGGGGGRSEDSTIGGDTWRVVVVVEEQRPMTLKYRQSGQISFQRLGSICRREGRLPAGKGRPSPPRRKRSNGAHRDLATR
ncbi:unnamed protein product [Lampetra fluviatilis]